MKQILRSAENAERLLKLTADTLILLDKEGLCVDIAVNKAKLWFLKEEKLRGKNILELLPPATYQQVYPEFKKVLTKNIRSVQNYELVLGKKSYYFKCIMQPYDGMILCQHRDITERSQRKIDLEKKNHELNEIQKAALIGSWRYDTSSNTICYRGHTGIMSNEKKQSMPIDTYQQFILHEDLDIFKNWLEQNINGNMKESIDYRVHLNNQIYYARVQAFSHIQDENGDIILEGYIQNITDIQQRRNDINLLTHAINNSIEDIFAVRQDGTLVFANRCFKEHHAIGNTEDIAKLEFFNLPSLKQGEKIWKELIASAKKDSENNNFIIYQPFKNRPEVLAYEGNAYWVTSDEGLETMWVFGRDISEMEIMKRDLLVAKEKAETSDQLKSAFLANMSHEIRTPLNAIVGFSRIIAESESTEERLSYYDIVEANNERLLQLINEILDLSKIEAGIVEFTMTPVNLHLLCKEIHDAHVFRCPAGVELIYDPSDENIVIDADKNRIFQVISNLLGNAFKFTTIGKISYGYQREGNQVMFHVTDTGIGIASDKIDHIFERFVKVDSFAPGTGLGLSICKTIIERLGGNISATSEYGVGTTFSFTLPLKEEVEITRLEATTEVCPEPDNTGNASNSIEEGKSSAIKTILVAEDTDCNYILIKAILGNAFKLERAKDGMEAVMLSEKLQPSLILMDMKMPNLGGLDATKIIREVSPTIPIIALTAFAYESDKQAALGVGCSDFLTKPFTQEDLKEKINKWLK